MLLILRVFLVDPLCARPAALPRRISLRELVIVLIRATALADVPTTTMITFPVLPEMAVDVVVLPEMDLDLVEVLAEVEDPRLVDQRRMSMSRK
jgi:hypothetical protein